VSEVAPALRKLETELADALAEHLNAIAHQLARALIGMAVEEHRARHGDGGPAEPRLCTSCRARLAAPQRTVCHSCRRRQRNERARLRQEAAAERAAARNGQRGPRAKELALGERTVLGHISRETLQ
jgi:hypothetical protein